MAKNKVRSVAFDPDLESRIQEKAKEMGLTWSAALRMLAIQGLKEMERG